MRLKLWVAVGSIALVPFVVSVGSAASRRADPKAEPESWEIPDSAKALKNPVAMADEPTLQAGKALWRAHCQTCHGATGKGDGPNARLHEKRKSVAPRNLTDPEIQALSDGEIFWRITNGYIDGDNVIMPAYQKKIPADLQRWQVVVYVRALGRGATAK
jgi:mono/diheme cytochrome c family protein